MMTGGRTVCADSDIQKTVETICFKFFGESPSLAQVVDSAGILVTVSEVVIERLLDKESTGVTDLHLFIGRPIHLKVETIYT